MNSPSPDTRTELLRAALHLFARHGYEGTSVRSIAQKAGTNIASIAYHFGGKAGLHRACAEFVGERIAAALPPDEGTSLPAQPDAARAELREALESYVSLVVGSSEAAEMIRFVLREMSEPGETAEFLFETVFEPKHARYCALWSIATGQPAGSDEVKLALFAMIGQAVYFRIAQPFVTRRMGWESFGPAETAKIATVLLGILDQTLKGSMR